MSAHVRSSCTRARDWASSALDVELSAFERALLDAHLSGCSGCRAFAAETEAFTTALRAAELEPLPQPVQVGGLTRIRTRIRRGSALRRVQLPAAAALVLVAAGLGGALGTLRGAPAGLDHTIAFSPITRAPSGDPLLRDLRLASLIQPAAVEDDRSAAKPPLPVDL